MLDENPEELISLSLGNKLYEMSNHLGNVLTVINDIKIPISSVGIDVDGYLATIVSTADYSPFGVQLDGRTVSAESYRYGYQGQEKDDELKGAGNSVNYTYRMHDPRLGRFFAVDPLAADYPHNSPYAFSENRVLDKVELEGLETSPPKYVTMNGHTMLIQAVDNTSVASHVNSLPQTFLKPGETPKMQPLTYPKPPEIGPRKDPLYYRVEMAKKNLDNYQQYVIPFGGVMNKFVKGEDISNVDWAIDIVGVIPFGWTVKGGVIALKGGGKIITTGIKHVTGQHWNTMFDVVRKLAENGGEVFEKSTFFLNKGLNTALDKTVPYVGKWRPDVISVNNDGSLHLVEVISESQTAKDIHIKMGKMVDALTAQGYTVTSDVVNLSGESVDAAGKAVSK
jgi:RHS repeat-associated protein